MNIVTFTTADVEVSLTSRKNLKAKITEVFIFNKTEFQSLSYIFCSDEFLLDINRQFLQHDFYTDIITFNLADAKKPVEGEVYISIDRVKENAATHDVLLKEELHRVIFHGALHLCGFKDKRKADKTIMRNAEDFWLNNYLRST